MPSAKTRDALSPSCLFPDEAEIARLIMGPKCVKAWPSIAVVLERRGLPKVDPQFGGRYWPKVRAFFDDMYRMDDGAPFYAEGRPTTSVQGDRTGGVQPRPRDPR